MIQYKKTKNGTFIKQDGDRQISIPDDMGNTDRQELQVWLDAGNQLQVEEETTPGYNWQGLAIAFKLSQLNQLLTQLKDEGTNPQINAIWRISDELVQIITIPVFGESDRIAGMAQNIKALYEKLDEGDVEIPSSAKQEIADSLLANGFSSVVDILNV